MDLLAILASPVMYRGSKERPRVRFRMRFRVRFRVRVRIRVRDNQQPESRVIEYKTGTS